MNRRAIVVYKAIAQSLNARRSSTAGSLSTAAEIPGLLDYAALGRSAVLSASCAVLMSAPIQATSCATPPPTRPITPMMPVTAEGQVVEVG
jgi:hypothetical protein